MKPNEVVAEILKMKGYDSLKEPQKIALKRGLLDTDDNFIIISPTASGKTLVAEMVIYKVLQEGGRALYLVPSRALITEKLEEFDYLENEGFIVSSSGEEEAWDKANVVIATFETFYFRTLLNPVITQAFSLAIVDEFHILYDQMRGFNLEKSLILLREFNLRIICLSATFEDKGEVSEWLDAKLVTIPEKYRGIDLKEDLLPLYDVPQNKRLAECFCQLIEMENHPYLIFCRSKSYTVSRAGNFRDYLLSQHSAEFPVYDVSKIIKAMEKRVSRDLTDNEKLLASCLACKVGYHNALLNSEIRKIIEERFINNDINWLFTTTTLAYGFNSPAKSVVLYDTSLYDSALQRTKPIPVFMYIQMIGRAGRPQYYDKGEEAGYAYVVASSMGEAERIESSYFEKELETAKSHIGLDDYFRKAILELIYAERNHPQNIIDFFEKSFNTFQSRKNPLATYDLTRVLKSHMRWLIDNGFVTDEGAYGYKLTSDLGKVVVEFLMWNYTPYLLTSFKIIKEYLQEDGFSADFDTIYMLVKALEFEKFGIGLYRKSRKQVEEIEEFYASREITTIGSEEYTAYALWFGWMENKTLRQIENAFDVYADNIRGVARNVNDAIYVMEGMWKAMGKGVADEIKQFHIRLKEGVRPQEVSIVAHRGYGRAFAKDLFDTARGMIATKKGAPTPDETLPYDTVMNFYVDWFKKEGPDYVQKSLIGMSKHFKTKRSKEFLKLVEKELEEKKQKIS